MQDRPPRETTPARPGAAGFSLLELLVVLAIVAALAGVIVPALSADKDAAMVARAEAEVQAIAAALQTFASGVGAWPALDDAGRADGLAVLLSGSTMPTRSPWRGGTGFWSWSRRRGDLLQNHLIVNRPRDQAVHVYPTTGRDRWRGPYLDTCPLDPWDRPYVVNVVAGHSRHASDHRRMMVLSAGPDGRIQTSPRGRLGEDIAGDDVGCTVFQR